MSKKYRMASPLFGVGSEVLDLVIVTVTVLVSLFIGYGFGARKARVGASVAVEVPVPFPSERTVVVMEKTKCSESPKCSPCDKEQSWNDGYGQGAVDWGRK